jgi:hypothetical protein
MFQRSAFQPSAFQVPDLVTAGPARLCTVRIAAIGIALEARPVIALAVTAVPVLSVELSVPKIIPYRTRTNIEATFTDEDGDPVDPAIVRFSLVKPDGTVISVTSPTNITNPDVGVYRYEALIDQVGEWRYRWESVDDGEESSAQDSIVVPRLNT